MRPEAALLHAIEAVRIRAPASVLWFGDPVVRWPRGALKTVETEVLEACVDHLLRHTLYENFYVFGAARPVKTTRRPPDLARRRALCDALAQANCGSGYVSSGWEVVADVGTRRVLRRDGQIMRAAPAQCVETTVDGEPASTVGVRFPKDDAAVSPGFYLATSDVPFEPSSNARMVRLYFNTTPRSAVSVMAALTVALNREGEPFRLKALTDPGAYQRADSTVLYLFADSLERAIRHVYAAADDDLWPATPALTRTLRPGLGLAEDPGNGSSFGLDRCRLISRAIKEAHSEGRSTPRAVLHRLADVFAEEGLSLDRPHLGRDRPGDPFVLEGPPTPPRPGRRRATTPRRIWQTIARDLSAEAIWSGDRCAFIGGTLLRDRPGGTTAVRYTTVGGNLYGGSAGIGLFLAEAYAADGELAFRRTAEAAVRHALSTVSQIPPEIRTGFYSGWTGIAWAAIRAGSLLGIDELADAGRSLFARMRLEWRVPNAERDVTAGFAGGILGALALESDVDDARAFAVDLGEALVKTGRQADGAWAWSSPAQPGLPALTGFSHGAAGIALALNAVGRRTQRSTFTAAAAGAYAYERKFFDETAGNWKDLRQKSTRKGTGTSTYWCHGAPGIALARLLDDGDDVDAPNRAAEALVALSTTAAATRAGLNASDASFCLCHGLAGNAEIVALGSTYFGADFAGGADLYADVADSGARRSTGGEWVSGVTGAYSPSLMLGTAGIGLFYLRSERPNVPCLLYPPFKQVSVAQSTRFKPAQATAV